MSGSEAAAASNRRREGAPHARRSLIFEVSVEYLRHFSRLMIWIT